MLKNTDMTSGAHSSYSTLKYKYLRQCVQLFVAYITMQRSTQDLITSYVLPMSVWAQCVIAPDSYSDNYLMGFSLFTTSQNTLWNVWNWLVGGLTSLKIIIINKDICPIQHSNVNAWKYLNNLIYVANICLYIQRYTWKIAETFHNPALDRLCMWYERATLMYNYGALMKLYTTISLQQPCMYSSIQTTKTCMLVMVKHTTCTYQFVHG